MKEQNYFYKKKQFSLLLIMITNSKYHFIKLVISLEILTNIFPVNAITYSILWENAGSTILLFVIDAKFHKVSINNEFLDQLQLSVSRNHLSETVQPLIYFFAFHLYLLCHPHV